MYEFIFLTIVPPPDIIVSIDPSDAGVLIEGTYIDLVCIPLIGGISDTLIDVTITWFHDESVLTNSTEYTITKTSEQYGSSLRIEELQFNRDNLANYICKVKISDSLYIIGNENSSNITLSVKGKCNQLYLLLFNLTLYRFYI